MANKKVKDSQGLGTVSKKSDTSEISALSSDNADLEATDFEGTPQVLSAETYSPKTWENGEVIYEEDLNHMEQGIKNNYDYKVGLGNSVDSVEELVKICEVEDQSYMVTLTADLTSTLIGKSSNTATSRGYCVRHVEAEDDCRIDGLLMLGSGSVSSKGSLYGFRYYYVEGSQSNAVTRYTSEEEVDSELGDYLLKSGGTGTGRFYFNAGANIATGGSGTSGTSGYIRFLKVTITGTYCNAPIQIWLNQRAKDGGIVTIRFSNVNSTAPTVSSFYVYGDLSNVYYVSTSSNVFEFWIAKSESYDTVQVVDCKIADYDYTRMTLDWTMDFSTSAPSSNIATVMSLSDYLPLSGGTLTGRLTVSSTTSPLIQITNTNSSSGDTYVRATSWSGQQVAFGIGSGGSNRGIYDYGDDSGWIVYKDSSNAIHLGASTVGSGTKSIYLSSGIPTASSSTVGSGTKPVYLSSGTITASSSTVGGVSQPVYLSSGTVTACTSTTSSSWYIRHGWAWRTFNNVTFSDISLPSSYLPVVSGYHVVIVRYNNAYYLGAVQLTTSGVGSAYYYTTYGGSPVDMPSSATIYGTMVYRYQ